MKRRLAVLLLAGVLGPAGAVAAQESTDAARVARGAAVYQEQKCQACHSIGGVGGRRSALDGVGTRLTADQIRRWIVAPREMNPRVSKRAYDLPKQDLDALVAYLQTLKK